MKFIVSFIGVATMLSQSTSSRATIIQTTPLLRGLAAGYYVGPVDIEDPIGIQAIGKDTIIDELEVDMVDSNNETIKLGNKEGSIRGALHYSANPLGSGCWSEGIHHINVSDIHMPRWVQQLLVLRTTRHSD